MIFIGIKEECVMSRICQSCSMPMDDKKLFGTNADGTKNSDYCVYCYKNGEFIDKVSMQEYIEMCVPFAAQAGMTIPEMRHHCETVFPTLKRWKK